MSLETTTLDDNSFDDDFAEMVISAKVRVFFDELIKSLYPDEEDSLYERAFKIKKIGNSYYCYIWDDPLFYYNSVENKIYRSRNKDSYSWALPLPYHNILRKELAEILDGDSFVFSEKHK